MLEERCKEYWTLVRRLRAHPSNALVQKCGREELEKLRHTVPSDVVRNKIIVFLARPSGAAQKG